MDEQHECEWVRLRGFDYFICAISGCSKGITDKEISHRLNEYETLKKATDALSAAYCREVVEMTQLLAEAAGADMNVSTAEPLLAYADILEGTGNCFFCSEPNCNNDCLDGK